MHTRPALPVPERKPPPEQQHALNTETPKPSASLAPLPCGLPSTRSLRRAPGTVQEREERGGLTRRRAPNRKIDSVPPGGSADLGPRAPRTLGLGVSTSHCRSKHRICTTGKCQTYPEAGAQSHFLYLIMYLISVVRSSCCHGDGQASPRPLMWPPGPGHSGRSGQLRGRLTCLVLSPRKPVQATLPWEERSAGCHAPACEVCQCAVSGSLRSRLELEKFCDSRGGPCSERTPPWVSSSLRSLVRSPSCPHPRFPGQDWDAKFCRCCGRCGHRAGLRRVREDGAEKPVLRGPPAASPPPPRPAAARSPPARSLPGSRPSPCRDPQTRASPPLCDGGVGGQCWRQA
ncbi:hypothetical protein R6Z07M_002003 [Ovis aries]